MHLFIIVLIEFLPTALLLTQAFVFIPGDATCIDKTLDLLVDVAACEAFV